jgi:hypothetical protein
MASLFLNYHIAKKVIAIPGFLFQKRHTGLHQQLQELHDKRVPPHLVV